MHLYEVAECIFKYGFSSTIGFCWRLYNYHPAFFQSFIFRLIIISRKYNHRDTCFINGFLVCFGDGVICKYSC